MNKGERMKTGVRGFVFFFFVFLIVFRQVVLPLGYRGNFVKRLRNVLKEGNW